MKKSFADGGMKLMLVVIILILIIISLVILAQNKDETESHIRKIESEQLMQFPDEETGADGNRTDSSDGRTE